MRVRRALLIPRLALLSIRVPRAVTARWERYWAQVQDTGDGGDVLWDSSSSDEVLRYLDVLRAHADTGRPVVDVGCGNGRFTRALADHFASAVGIDLSAHAVELARRESSATANVRFRTADMTVPGTGRALAGELGPGTVFIRGVLHVLPRRARRRLAANVLDLLGEGGVVLVAETNYPGSLLSYLEHLGAGPGGLPHSLTRAISAGIPRPSRFGDAELDDTFPAASWDRVLTDATARIATVPLDRPATPDTMPDTIAGYLAVLRRRRDPVA